MTESETAGAEPVSGRAGRRRRVLLALLPLVLFLVLGGFLFRGLFLKPAEIPSVLLGRPVPSFELPPIEGRTPGLSSADLAREVSLVNVFASWCISCRHEHPFLMRLRADGVVPVHGLNYKDDPGSALAWLQRFGDPYERVGSDVTGRVGIDWGVYGVPESFVVDAQGRIVCKHIGPIYERDLNEKILPAIAAARAGTAVKC